MNPFTPPLLDDTAELLQALVRGDGRALEALYRRHAEPVFRYAHALSGDAAAAADATHDAFVVLASNASGFDPARGALGAWLAGIARHGLLARHRRQALELVADDATLDELPECAISPEQLLVQRQDLTALWGALRALPWVLREAVVLVDLQDRPYVEAAAIAGCELNTLRTRLHRGRARLVAMLAPAEPRRTAAQVEPRSALRG